MSDAQEKMQRETENTSEMDSSNNEFELDYEVEDSPITWTTDSKFEQKYQLNSVMARCFTKLDFIFFFHALTYLTKG